MPHALQSLKNSLGKYTPDDDAEEKSKDRILSLMHSSSDPTDRNQFSPGHLTASAFVVTPDRNQLVLILHKKLKRWLQPGGHIDPEDTGVLEAAVREVKEEVGLDVGGGELFDLDIHPIPETQREPAHDHFDIRFLFVADHQTIRPGSDVEDARWVSVLDWPDLRLDSGSIRVHRKLTGPGGEL